MKRLVLTIAIMASSLSLNSCITYYSCNQKCYERKAEKAERATREFAEKLRDHSPLGAMIHAFYPGTVDRIDPDAPLEEGAIKFANRFANDVLRQVRRASDDGRDGKSTVNVVNSGLNRISGSVTRRQLLIEIDQRVIEAMVRSIVLDSMSKTLAEVGDENETIRRFKGMYDTLEPEGMIRWQMTSNMKLMAMLQFSLSHEYGHRVLGHHERLAAGNVDCGARKEMETEADLFASLVATKVATGGLMTDNSMAVLFAMGQQSPVAFSTGGVNFRLMIGSSEYLEDAFRVAEIETGETCVYPSTGERVMHIEGMYDYIASKMADQVDAQMKQKMAMMCQLGMDAEMCADIVGKPVNTSSQERELRRCVRKCERADECSCEITF